MRRLTLCQAAVEAQIDGGPAVVRAGAAIVLMERPEPDDIPISPKEPDRQGVALADERRPAEDHTGAGGEIALQWEARVSQAKRDSVLHRDRVFARVHVLEDVGVGDAPDTRDARAADLGEGVLELGEERN